MDSFVETRRPRVLLGCSGSVATLKVPELVAKLSEFAEVRLILSSTSAAHFLNKSRDYNPIFYDSFLTVGGLELVIQDDQEWDCWNRIGDPVVHIELRNWADVFILAPASANTIAKISSGIADTLLLAVLRAWDFKKPFLVAPAMNTVMWDHPVTLESIAKMNSWGCLLINPVSKLLACNQNGNGALAAVDDIISTAKQLLSQMRFSTPNEEEPIVLEFLHSEWISRKRQSAYRLQVEKLENKNYQWMHLRMGALTSSYANGVLTGLALATIIYMVAHRNRL